MSLRNDLAFERRHDWRLDQLCQDADRVLADAIEHLQLRRTGPTAQRALGRLREARRALT